MGGSTDEGASSAQLACLRGDCGKVIETLLHLPANERGYRLAVRRRAAPRDDEFITWLYNPDYTVPPPDKKLRMYASTGVSKAVRSVWR